MQECFISANSKENSTVFKPEIKKFDHDGHKTQLKSSICSVVRGSIIGLYLAPLT